MKQLNIDLSSSKTKVINRSINHSINKSFVLSFVRSFVRFGICHMAGVTRIYIYILLSNVAAQDPCAHNNGGCDVNSECFRVNDDYAVICVCYAGYIQDGNSCTSNYDYSYVMLPSVS